MFANKLASPQTRSTSESIWVVLIELQTDTLLSLVLPRDATFIFKLTAPQFKPYATSVEDTKPLEKVLITNRSNWLKFIPWTVVFKVCFCLGVVFVDRKARAT